MIEVLAGRNHYSIGTPEEYDKVLRAQIETLSRLAVAAGLRTK